MLEVINRSTDYSEVLMNSTNIEAKNVKVTLVRLPMIFTAQTYSAPVALPLGLTYLAAVLEEARFRVEIIDAVGMGINTISYTQNKRFKMRGIPESELLQQFENDQADYELKIIGVTIMFSQEWPHVRDLIRKIKKNQPQSIIVAGGEHSTAMPEYSMRDCPEIDYIIRGEGELSFLQLVSSLSSGKDVSKIQGLAYIEDGLFVENGLSPRIKSLDALPWPAWHLINLESYFRPHDAFGMSRARTMGILATRGCPYQCTFCSNDQMYTTQYKLRPVVDVIEEIKYYKITYKITNIEFYDLTAIVNSKWILDFANEIKKSNLDIEWQLPSGTRSEALNEEVLKSIKAAGLLFVTYAPESGSERTLTLIKKRINLRKMYRSVKNAKKYKLFVKVNYIIGFPKENRRDLLKTAWSVMRMAFLNVDDCNVSLFSPYPGSELYEELRKSKKIADINDSYFEGLTIQFDLLIKNTVCEKIPALELMIYRALMMCAFYSFSYLKSPTKVIRIMKIIFGQMKEFQAQCIFEQRIFDIKHRRVKFNP